MKIYNSIEEAEQAIFKIQNNKEWNMNDGEKFDFMVELYSQDPYPRYFIRMYRRDDF